MGQHDWEETAETIRSKLDLSTNPVGIKFLAEAKDLLDFPEARLLRKSSICHMVALARHYGGEGVVGASREGMKCVWGAASVGLIRSPDRLRNGLLYEQFTKDRSAARELHESIGMIGDHETRYKALLMAPFGLMPVEPDVIVMYVNPAQALRLIIAHVYHTGRSVETRITGQVSLCASISRVLNGKDFDIDIPCMGDRLFGMPKEEEMITTLSPAGLDRLLDGLYSTEDAASYPYPPFLNWPVVLPPGMETTKSDI